MFSCSGFVVAFPTSDKDYRSEDVGPEFSFQDVVGLVESTLAPYNAQTRTMAANGCCQVSFYCGSNHDRRARKDLEALFAKLADLGSGLFAFCSVADDEFGQDGGAWEFRVNHPHLDLTGIDIVRRDFTKRDWPQV